MSFLGSGTKVGKAVGTCHNCGRTHKKDRPADLVYCPCYKECPQCGQPMTPYTPDLGKAYNTDRGIHILYVCNNCDPPYHSKLMPVEVTLD